MNLCVNIEIPECRQTLASLDDLSSDLQKLYAGLLTCVNDHAPSWCGTERDFFIEKIAGYGDALTSLRQGLERGMARMRRSINKAQEIEDIW